MLHVILIDDEPLIRNGLQKMFSWEDFHMEISAVFPNGSLAFEYIQTHPVDLVITDIKMPVMTGIDFMTACRNHGIKTKFIVLSGFSDFAYVKSAAQIGIENYLLKPIDHQEMSRTLRQVQKKIEAEQRNKIFVDEGIRIFKNNLLFRLITGKISVEDLQERQDYVDLPLENCNYQIAVIKFSAATMDSAQLQGKPPLNSVIHHLSCYPDIFPITDYTVRFLYLLFCNYDGQKKRINPCLSRLSQYLSVTSDFRISIAVGKLVTTVDEIVGSYRSAFLLINTATVCESADEIRWSEDLEKNHAFMLPHIEIDQLVHLNEKCLYKSEDSIQEIIADVLYNNRFIPLEGLQMLAVMTLSKVYENYLDPKADSAPSKTDIHDLINPLADCTDYRSIRDQTFAIIHTIFLCQQNNGEFTTGASCKMILRFLESHYAEDINLKTIADRFHVNALYLGRKIKADTGYTFNDYINQLRLKNAAELLQNTSLSAKQIAKRVGYSNDKYFSIQFKKYQNMTPGEFRKKYTQINSF